MLRISRRSLTCLAVAVLVACSTALRADVDVAVANGDKVTGTLMPADEMESFRVLVPAGAVFKLKVKSKPLAKGKPKPALALRLFDPDGGEVAQDDVVIKKSSARLKGYVAAKTGEYRIQVTGDGATPGNYMLVVKWKSRTVFRFQLDDAGPGDPSRVRVPIDAGAAVTIKLKAAKGSSAAPVAAMIEAASGFQRMLPPPTTGAPAHVVKKELVPVFGEATIVTSGGGPYAATITVKPPRPAKRKIDLSQKTLGGGPAGGGLAVGQVVGPGGGAVAVTTGESDIIGGAGVLVPPGALGSPTSILIGTATPMPNQQGGEQPAGPTIFFGPEGLQFGEDVTVTIPFDVEAFAANSGALSVFTRDADGNVTEITDFTVDLDAGTCSFPVSHFSSFRVFGPTLPPAVEGDIDFDGSGDLVLTAPSSGAGRVYVVHGGSLEDVAVGTTGAAPVVLTGEGTTGRFGEIVATGDLNQDGREDLIVTAPQAGVNGRVYMFFGSASFASRGAAAADVIIYGQDRDFGFGVRLAVGDVNGDGVDDVVVGAEGSSAGVGGAGAVYVFLGSREISSRSAGFADVILTGTASGDGFGAAVGIGDVIGDSSADVIVGADEVLGKGTGIVFVFAGGPGLSSLKSKKADVTLSGVSTGDGFGLEIAIGDVTGDGRDDIVVAAAGDDDAGVDAGAVYVYRGGNLAAPPWKLTGEGDSDDFGFDVTVRDLDGVLGAEVVVTAERSAGGRGRAYVFAGGPGFAGGGAAAAAAAILTGENAGDHVSDLQPPWDVTGDGVPDLIVYATRFAAGAGRAYVFPGGALPATGSIGQALVAITGQAGEWLGGRPPLR